jgi:outer membrane protein assembly factor BamB
MTAAVVALFAAVTARGENWAEFRGPTGQGLAAEGKKYPAEWNVGTGKNVAWKQPIPGAGWSSPIVYDGKVYLTTAVGAKGKVEQSLRALALDAASGKVLWDKEVFKQDAGAPRVHPKASHANPTPITDGKRIYVHFGHQGTAALDPAGNIVWKNAALKYRPVHGNGGSPVLIDDLLVFSSDGADTQKVIALDRASGKVVWQTPRKVEVFKPFSFCTPLVIDVGGRKQIVSPAAGYVGAYDPKTGAEIWRVRYGEGYSVVPRPVFGNGLLFLCTGFDSPKLIAVRPDGKGDVTDTHVAWTVERGAPLDPSPLLVGNELYFVSDMGVGTCVDAAGGKVHRQQRLGGNYSASPIFADGKIYFTSEDGAVSVFRAGPAFELLGRNEMGERTFASPAAVDGALYLRTERHLYRIQER